MISLTLFLFCTAFSVKLGQFYLCIFIPVTTSFFLILYCSIYYLFLFLGKMPKTPQREVGTFTYMFLYLLYLLLCYVPVTVYHFVCNFYNIQVLFLYHLERSFPIYTFHQKSPFLSTFPANSNLF